MNGRALHLRGTALYGFLLAAWTVACGSPVQPSGSVTVTTPVAVTPANGAVIANSAQPITLVVNDAVTGGSGSNVTYTFEVATDAGFTNKVQTVTVPQTSGQTSAPLDVLGGGHDYYWHVRTVSGTTTGVFTDPLKFTVGSAVALQAPAVFSPANGVTGLAARPTLTVTNAARSGPAGAITYRFDISLSSSFASVLISGTVPEGAGQTSFTPPADLALNTTFYWRAEAIDASNGAASPFSATASFATGNGGPVLWPGVQPPGTPGHAIMGDNWQTQNVVSFDGTPFTSPTLDELQIFDLLDRGFDPQGAIDWMHANGYATDAVYYPSVLAIGFQYEYMALVDGRWNLVIRAGA